MGVIEGEKLCSRVNKMSITHKHRIKRRKKRTMEITSSNFKEKLPEIEAAIDTASFLAIDGEFTGLNAYRGISHFDLPAERYDKLQESASFSWSSLVCVLSTTNPPQTATPTRPSTSTCGPGRAAGVPPTPGSSVRLQASTS
jgi:hypothetical protein